MVCLPVSASSCLGYISRDSGHSRVPAPPGQDHRNQSLSRSLTPTAGALAAADRIIAEAGARHVRGIVEVAPVEDHRRAQRTP